MRQVEILTLDERLSCGFCCNEFGPGVLALRWNEMEFCTHECLENYVEQTPGRDFVAAQDQALAEAARVLGDRPDSFILLYYNEDGIGSAVFAPPELIISCLPHLAQLALENGSVAPPD